MADFCWKCVEEMWPEVDPVKNDMNLTEMMPHHPQTWWWGLCEGCGQHVFTRDGHRVCDRVIVPGVDRADWPDVCAECERRLLARLEPEPEEAS